jgi:RNA polymerase sigma-70 factor (ECF subfamily)
MDRASFEQQLPAHLPALRALSRRLIGHKDDADDVLQEALARAARNLAAFRAESSLKTWLFSVTTNVALDHLRSRKRWNNQVMVDACDSAGRTSVEAKYGDPSMHFDVGQHIAFCFTCIGRSLEPEQHAALVLSEMFGLTNVEAAEVLNLTEPKLRHALSAARDAMRTEYEGLCALVNKSGACYQCKALRGLAPDAQKGPPLPAEPLPFDERMQRVREAAQARGVDERLSDYFFTYTHRMNVSRQG